jgi:hypothetical protein
MDKGSSRQNNLAAGPVCGGNETSQARVLLRLGDILAEIAYCINDENGKGRVANHYQCSGSSARKSVLNAVNGTTSHDKKR